MTTTRGQSGPPVNTPQGETEMADKMLKNLQDVLAYAQEAKDSKGKKGRVAFIPLQFNEQTGEALLWRGDEVVGTREVWQVISWPLWGCCVAVERLRKRREDDVQDIRTPHTEYHRAARLGACEMLAQQSWIGVREFIPQISRFR